MSLRSLVLLTLVVSLLFETGFCADGDDVSDAGSPANGETAVTEKKGKVPKHDIRVDLKVHIPGSKEKDQAAAAAAADDKDSDEESNEEDEGLIIDKELEKPEQWNQNGALGREEVRIFGLKRLTISVERRYQGLNEKMKAVEAHMKNNPEITAHLPETLRDIKAYLEDLERDTERLGNAVHEEQSRLTYMANQAAAKKNTQLDKTLKETVIQPRLRPASLTDATDISAYTCGTMFYASRAKKWAAVEIQHALAERDDNQQITYEGVYFVGDYCSGAIKENKSPSNYDKIPKQNFCSKSLTTCVTQSNMTTRNVKPRSTTVAMPIPPEEEKTQGYVCAAMLCYDASNKMTFEPLYEGVIVIKSGQVGNIGNGNGNGKKDSSGQIYLSSQISFIVAVIFSVVFLSVSVFIVIA